MKNVLKLLTKSVLIPLGLTAAASATDSAIQKNIFGSGMTTLIISNEKMNDIMKIVKSLEKSGLLIKGVSETIKNEAREQKGGFLGMFLGTLGASLFGNLLTGNELISKNHTRVCTNLNYVEYFLILTSTVTGGIAISDFASLVDILMGIKNLI